MEVWLPDFLYAQSLGSSVLWSCLTDRLPWSAGEAEFRIELSGVWNGEPAEGLKLVWDATAPRVSPAGVPERTVTELAGCAMAVILCSAFLEASAERLAADGDRFDYWLWWGDAWFGLEVSGTLLEDRGDLRQRHRDKVLQLMDNPYGLGGLVVVTSFTTQSVLFSVHLGGEEVVDETA